MKKHSALCFTLLLGLAVLAVPVTSQAECIDITPASWDYGDVEVGTSESQIFTILSCAESSVTLYIIEIVDDATGAFTITSELPLGVIPGGETREIEVALTPPSLGAHEAFLHIYSNAPGNYTYISLFGTGVSEEPGPGEVMADLIEFFEASVEAGTLVGDGPGSSASGRLKAFRNMLNAANDLIVDGDIALACEQLQDAKDRADGVHPPPDFVAGSARADVEAMIVEVMAELGCP